MRKNLVIADDFYEDPQSVRNFALRAQYYYPYESEEAIKAGRVKASWMSSQFANAHNLPFQVFRAVNSETGIYLAAKKIDLAHWNLGFPTNSEGKPVLARAGNPAKLFYGIAVST